MIYVEFLRVRTALIWHAGILGAILAMVLLTNSNTHVSVDGHPAITNGLPLPLALLIPIAMFYATIFALSVGASLNRENATRDLSWTKPISRTVLALQFVLVDLAGVAIAFALAFLAICVVVLRIGAIPIVGDDLWIQLALGLGVAAMWYALIQVLTFWFGGGARAIAGILWPVAFAGLGFARLPGIYGSVARAIDIVNPLSYMGGFSINRSGGGEQQSLWTMPVESRALIVWFFTAAFCAIAVTLWRRKGT